MIDHPGLSRPNTCAGRLQRIAYATLLEHHANDEIPTNGRFLFYELEGLGHVFKIPPPKKRGTSSRPGPMELSEATMRLRELGLIEWDWIVDETRTLVEWDHAASVYEYIEDRIYEARINPWDDDPPLLIVESRSLGGVLRNLTYEYLVPIAATGGQVGGFLHTDVIPLLQGSNRPVLYLGDLDLQGAQIEANTRLVIERECGPMDWTRIALTHEQVEERGIDPLVKVDKRFRPAKYHNAWECEALGQSVVLSLVREALDALLPMDLDVFRERERDEREKIREVLES